MSKSNARDIVMKPPGAGSDGIIDRNNQLVRYASGMVGIAPDFEPLLSIRCHCSLVNAVLKLTFPVSRSMVLLL